MKEISFTILLLIMAVLCHSQDKAEIEAADHVMHLDMITDLTNEQKANILEIFKDFIKERNVLNKEDFPEEARYHEAVVELYAKSKRKVYTLMTVEQLKVYEKYRKEEQERMKQKAQDDLERIIKSN